MQHHSVSPLKSYVNKFIKTFFVLLLIPFLVTAQNLVPNPSFEGFTTCPVGFSQFNGYVGNWVNPSSATPDYMNACANPNPAGTPQNGTGYQVPRTGNGYAGFYSGSDSYREYIQVQLTSALTAGTNYTFKMYVVIHNRSQTATDDLGAYFSSSAPSTGGVAFLGGSLLPQVANAAGSVIKDSANWTLIQGNFIATGGQRYVTIGHFKPDASSTYQTINYGSQGAYYYVDDVSLTVAGQLPVELLSFTATLEKNADKKDVLLKWITASEENNCCFEIERSNDGSKFVSIGNMPGRNNSTSMQEYSFTDKSPMAGINYYRLKQIDNNNNSEYLKTVAVKNDEGISVQFINSNDKVNIYVFNYLNEKISMEIYDASGKVVYERKNFNDTSEEINLGFLRRGIYFFRMNNEEKILFSEKFLR